MTNSEAILQKLFAEGNSYWLTRFVILRLLGFVYAVAFLVAANQLVPLIGEHGLTPATHFLTEVQTQLGSRSAGMFRVPTLFWFGISDHALSIFSWVGFALSLIVLAGTRTRSCLRSFGQCTCRSFTSARFGTVTAGKFSCSKRGSYRFFFVHCSMAGRSPSPGHRSW